MELQPNNTRAGTIGGTFLVLLIQLDLNELVKTGVLAGIGAFVSFLVSVALRWLARRVRERRGRI